MTKHNQVRNSQWTPTTKTIQGLPCLEHSATHELCAFGAKGQIFEHRPGELRAIVYRKHGELLYKVPLDKLQNWVRRMEIPSDLDLQLMLTEV